jgi:hypothetical protein
MMGAHDEYTYRTCIGTAICVRTVITVMLRSGLNTSQRAQLRVGGWMPPSCPALYS